MKLTQRFDQAYHYASQLHRDQVRKGSQIAYLSHLLAVAALVLEDGGDEDEAIAALLHDAPEDQGGRRILVEIDDLFGAHVAEIVDGCTDTYDFPKPAWRTRKERYLDHLQHVSPDVMRVALADKLHNARSILDDLRRNGSPVWKRFNGGKQGTIWYYQALLQIFQERSHSVMTIALKETIRQIEALAGGDETG